VQQILRFVNNANDFTSVTNKIPREPDLAR
jgi:hypothetical protein